MHMITMILILILGGVTIFFHDPMFIKWKPSVIYWLFALVLIGSQFIGKKPILKRMMGDKIHLPDKAWLNLSISWAIFFTAMGAVNLYVVYNYSTNTWVNFKLFGTLGLTLVFAVLQAFYIARFMKNDLKINEKNNK